MKLSIVIPNYNGEINLRNNIPKLIEVVREYREDLEVIIIDDASSDNSPQVIKDLVKNTRDIEVIPLFNEKNLGFASNVNRGVNRASGEIIILLNTDVIPRTGFLKPLLNHFSDEKVFAVGCLDESLENEKIILRGRGIGEWKRGFLVHSRGEISKSDTLWVSGGSGAFRKSLWVMLGGFDALYDPFYWEDIDLSYRARKMGFFTLFENKSIVRHEHEKGVIKSTFSKNEVKRIAFRNQFFFVWKNADISNLASHILWLPYHILKGIASGEIMLIFGLLTALIRIPVIIQSRLKVRKFFIKKDSEVIITK